MGDKITFISITEELILYSSIQLDCLITETDKQIEYTRHMATIPKDKYFFGTIYNWLSSTRCCIIKDDFGLNIVKTM